MKRKLMLLMTCLFIGIGLVNAQISKVTGTVISEEDGLPVVGASILVKGTTMGTVTDLDGKFTLENLPSTAKTLMISYIGMHTQEVAIQRTLSIVLKADTETLDEVIVVAYGTAKKSAFTGSASVMKADKLEKRQVSNLTNALSGSVSGVQTVSYNGQPGTSAKVYIRGIGSMNASVDTDPLYVVDGIPFEGDISSINTQDIESMTVLKDAAASALYGARGANGVILVTTKKGQSGDARVTFDARWGVNSRMVGKYDVIKDTDTYMETLYQSFKNEGMQSMGYSSAAAHAYANNNLFGAIGYPIYTLPQGEGLIGMDGKVNPNAVLGYSDGKYYFTPDNWDKEMIGSEMRQEYNMSVAGGSDRINYYFSAGYLQDGGIIENSGFDRITTRLNVDYQAKKWLKFGANMSYINSKSRYPGDQTNGSSSANAFNMAHMIAPVYPMFQRKADGSMDYDSTNGRPIYDYGNGQTGRTRNWMSMSNPMGDLLYNTEEYLMDIFSGKWYAELSPIEGLKLTASYGYNVDNTRYHSLGNSKYGQSASYGGNAYQNHDHTSGFNQQYLATYRKSFGNHNFDVLAGYESYDYRYENSYATGQNLYKDGDFTVNNTIDQKRGGGSRSEYSTRGIIGRLNYDYAEKYYLSASYRRDASSRFHPDNRWGNFWSASAAWVVNKEHFLEDIEWIDILKLKASYGQQGNDRIGNNYAYLDQYSVTGADGVFSDGKLVYKGNKDLTWEKSDAFNAGVDFTLFGSKLSGTIEYFSRKTSDMLYSKPVANSNGYSSIPVNIGSMTNSGMEIELSYTPIETKNLKWSLFGNATFSKNKINELDPELNGEWISGSTIYTEGESMYRSYIVKYAGVDAATGYPLYWTKTTPAADATEEEKAAFVPEWYATSNYDEAYANGRQATDDLLPTVYGGFGTSLDFFGFDFSIQMAYQLGGKIFDYSYQALMHNGDGSSAGQNWHVDMAKAWTPENTNTDVPRLNRSDKYTNELTDRWLTSSNYLSVNNITLGYTLPKNWLRSLNIQALRLYVAADNVALFSTRKGMDPRQGFRGTSGDTYSALRTISGGIKLTF
jgi:TonB-linked SusC/RagA family outer membrane protein